MASLDQTVEGPGHGGRSGGGDNRRQNRVARVGTYAASRAHRRTLGCSLAILPAIKPLADFLAQLAREVANNSMVLLEYIPDGLHSGIHDVAL